MGTAQTAAEEDTGGLDEILVTAQKREEGVSRVPISIAAVGGEKLESYGTANLEQVSSSIPNLRITQTGIANKIAIRGISSGDNKGFEQSAAMFVDGLYYGRDQLVRMPIVDVERVEVLRGPQPTLFGKNAIAGAISIINRKPSDWFEGSVSGSYEFEHNEAQLTGVINAPLGEQAGVRLVGYYRNMDGYMYNTSLGRTEPQVDTAFGRATFSLGDSDPVSATLKIEYADFKTLGQARENFGPRGTFSASPFFSTMDTTLDWRSQNNGYDSRNKIFDSSLNLDIGVGDHTINLISGYVHYKAQEILDVDFTGLPMLDGTNQGETYDQLSQEVRLTSPGDGPLTYMHPIRTGLVDGVQGRAKSPCGHGGVGGAGTLHLTGDATAILQVRQTSNRIEGANGCVRAIDVSQFVAIFQAVEGRDESVLAAQEKEVGTIPQRCQVSDIGAAHIKTLQFVRFLQHCDVLHVRNATKELLKVTDAQAIQAVELDVAAIENLQFFENAERFNGRDKRGANAEMREAFKLHRLIGNRVDEQIVEAELVAALLLFLLDAAISDLPID